MLYFLAGLAVAAFFLLCAWLWIRGAEEPADPKLFARKDASTPEMLEELAKLDKPLAAVTHAEFWRALNVARARIRNKPAVAVRDAMEEKLQADRAEETPEEKPDGTARAARRSKAPAAQHDEQQRAQ